MYSQRETQDQWAIANHRYTKYAPDRYVKSITGLSYNSRLFHNRLQNDLFGKLYHLKTEIENGLSWEKGYFSNHGLSLKKTYAGAGLGSSFRISKQFLVKASAEYAYRLPMVYELLGDGVNTVANTNLLAESSMNYNVGAMAKCVDKKGVIVNFSGSGFYRFANHFIRMISGGRRGVYTNFDKVLIRGAELEAKVSFKKKLHVIGNVSYQQVLDNARYLGNTNMENYTYRQQLPNTPHLFGNMDISYKFDWAKWQLEPYYSLLFVDEFYLGFANVARANDKYVIPVQFVQDIGCTFSSQSSRYSLSLECTNFTNTMPYDNFKLQKPGRSFSLKLNLGLFK
jgi:outer membrane receptor protein involved in Fe transport